MPSDIVPVADITADLIVGRYVIHICIITGALFTHFLTFPWYQHCRIMEVRWQT